MTIAPLPRALPTTWPAEARPRLRRGFDQLLRVAHPRRASGDVARHPYRGAATVDVSTGLTYPAKAERARRDPRVALLFADPVGAGLENPPVVLVQGLATVRDADLQAGLDRYVAAATTKLPDSVKGMPWPILRRAVWYYARIGSRSRRCA